MSVRPLILGIETSCDDTACAIVDRDGRVLSSVVSSQLEAHRPYGGVVPEIASREHLRNWPPVSQHALELAGLDLSEVDAIAATRGPGLIGCLLVGLSIGRAMAMGLSVPFYGVHHLEGHIYSPFLGSRGFENEADEVPSHFQALVVSGGHTSILDIEDGTVTTLVETRDDAIGEVFDKIGKRLGLPYPQGPRVDQLAETGDPDRFELTIPRLKGGQFFFSYSGLKSQTLRQIEALPEEELEGQLLADVLASFRRAAVAQVIHRLERLQKTRAMKVLAVSGGVAANRELRRELAAWAAKREVDLRLVPISLAGDNAAMISFAAQVRMRRGEVDDPRKVVPASRLPFPAAG